MTVSSIKNTRSDKWEQVPVRTHPRLFSAALYLAFGAFLFTACGSSGTEQEEPVGKVGLDSATAAKLQHERDSMAALPDDMIQDSNPTTRVEDSIAIAETLRLLDSMDVLKK